MKSKEKKKPLKDSQEMKHLPSTIQSFTGGWRQVTLS